MPQIAYVRLTDGYWQIWVSDVQGQHQRQLTNDPTDKRSPKWSIDGSAIFYRNANHEPFMLHLADGKPERILVGTGLIGEVTPTTDPSRVVYARFRSNVLDKCDIWTARLDGGERRMLTNQLGLQYHPAVSPDGRRIAYISGHGFGTHELFVCDADGRNPRQLTTNEALELSPAWPPDGRRIAYASNETGDFQIWVIGADGGGRRQLTRSGSLNGDPSWSPDGKQIAFTSNRGGEPQIWAMNADGSSTRQITHGSPSMAPSWRRIKS